MKNEVNRALVAKKTKIMKSINQVIRRGDGERKFLFRYAAMVLVLLTIGIGNAWGAAGYLSVKTADPAQGLVYCAKGNSATAPTISQYQEYYPGGCVDMTGVKNPADAAPQNLCYISLGGGNGPSYGRAWAKPARGYQFSSTKKWSPWCAGTNVDANPESVRNGWDGDNDDVRTSAGNSQCTYTRMIAYFEPATAYVITYAVPVGGSYHVGYKYLKTRERSTASFYDAAGNANSYKDYEFYWDQSEQYDLNTSLEDPYEVTSYAADEITLTTPTTATNFIGWYEGSTFLSMGTGDNHSYAYTPHATGVTVSAQFKELAWGDVSGDLTVNVGTGSEAELTTYGDKKVYVACPTLIGSWNSSDFTITTTTLSNGYGSIALGSATIDATNHRLEIPYSFTATHWGGIDVTVTVTPAYGEAKQFTIACSSEEVVGYEACIEESGVRTHTGTLAAMMTQANTMDNKPTVKLMNNGVTITTPVSFIKSMTFDVNGKVLTANCASAFSIDAADVDVKIIDGSFTQVGEIHTSYASASTVSVVTFTQAAKLTMNGGTLSAENTGAGAAYGIDVQQGSIFYMTGGDMTVTATTGNAQGVHVATASDYATLNGGAIAVSAPTSAYGLWSAGQSNITDATVSVATTSGANAYGVYVNGGVSTVTTTDFTVNANTTDAYGAYVGNTGRLNFNGGKLAATADKDKAYGAYVASGATAMLQQNAKVTAEVSTGNGTANVEVCGVHNLGTVSLNNISVTATNNSTTATESTNYAAAISTNTGAVSTTIEDGTYTANAETGYAYAIRHRTGTLTVDGGTFKGILRTSGVGAFGAHLSDNATIANATLYGETKGTGSKAHGIVGNAGTVTLTNCDLTGKSNTNIAYAIYSRTNLTATGCTLTATTSGTDQAYGINAQAGTNVINNCNATVSANTISAYGAYHKAGVLTINGGVYDVVAVQKTASAAQDSKLYGIYNESSQTTTVTNATFTAIASNAAYSQNVYGAYINGTLNSTGATYTSQSKINAYGIFGESSSTLTLSNNSISTRTTNGTVSYGIYAKKNFTIDGDMVSAIASTTDVYAMYFGASSEGEVLSGKFSAEGSKMDNYGSLNSAGTAGKVKLKGGVYTTNINLTKYAASGYHVYSLDETHPDYSGGYRFTVATENPSPYVCKIVGGNYYATLEAALHYTKDNASSNHVIVMTQDYTLPAGDYELPSNATLLIPHKVDQNAIYGDGANDNNKTTIVGVRSEFMRLTLAANAKLNASGKIEVSGQMYCQESGRTTYINGPYARIHMEDGSLIQLNSGAVLYAWGYVTGSGNENSGKIIVKNNAEVHEMFQVYGMPSMSNLASSYRNSYKFFPVQQYFIQNVEVPTTYYYNSRMICGMSNYYKGAVGVGFNKDDNIKVVGTSNALFLVDDPDESSWVRKSYDAVHDYQVWEVNSSAKLGSLSIKLNNDNTYSMNSADYILPITSNMKIHIKDGNFTVTQSSQLIPGSQLEIDKTGTLTINAKDGNNQNISFYVFDKDQSNLTSKVTVDFSPGWTNGAPSRTVADAALNVHGKIDVKGKLFTTNKGTETSKTDGANIYSNNDDAGTITFNAAAPSATTLTLMTSATATKVVNVESAKLKNGDGSYAETNGTNSGEAWVYINGTWQKTYTNGCFEVIGSTVYAKPSEYVALTNTAKDANDKWIGVAESNHTYAAEGGKILILMDECQWWEVVATSDPAVFKCEKEGYEGFYYYDTSTSKWKLKTVNVTFYMKETGTNASDKVIVTDYNGIPDQSVIASNPTKETTAEYTYAFYGWKSSVTGNEYSWTAELEPATAEMSYRPVFTATKRNYTITLNDANNGAAVPLEVPYGEEPSYTPKKDADAQYTYTFEGWTPALQAVNGPATYTANWSSMLNRYTITWMDGETVLETDKNQLYGTTTSFEGTTPTKDPDNNYAYTFSGWLNSLTGNMRANNETVTGAITYTAQYTTTPRYKITFANYDGTDLQKDYYVTQGEHPIYNGLTPGRVRDLDGYYRFTGWKNSNGDSYAPNDILPVVTGKETYTAQYDYVNELYLITLNNVDGNGASWSGKFGVGSTPFYNRDNNDVAVEPTKASTAQYEYTFTGWDPELQVVSGEATYTAQFEQHTRKYDITFANLDGNGAHQTIEVEYGQTPVSPVTPEKVVDHTTYAFTGWNTTIVPVAGNATYTAQFSATGVKQRFTITFDPDNGGATQVSEVEYGATPAWSGAEPTKSATAQYTYAFAGWYPEVAPVTGEETYSAQYTQTLNKYTVRFVNYDGTELQSSELAYGATPSYSGTPKKPLDEANAKAYTFNDWSPAIGSVTGNVTYTAQYNEMALVATVTTSAGVTTPYSTWASALSAAKASANNTLKLYSNVSAPNNNEINNDMTIDLNGHTVSFSGSQNGTTRLFYVNGVALTVNDTKGGGAMSYRNTSTGSNSQAYTIYVNGTASVTINGGTLRAERTSGNYVSAAVHLYSSNSTLYLNDGELIATENSGGSGYAVSHRGTSYGYSYIRGGKLKGKSAIFQNPATARVTLSGGYYSKDPGSSVTVASGYDKPEITSATVDPEYNNGYTYKVAKSCTVTFNANGHGTAPAAVTAYTGNLMSAPTAPSAAGYNFNGWYKESDCIHQWNFASDIVTEAMTLYAKWTPRDDTPYIVKHLWQNVEDDDYTEHESEGMTGTTEASTAAVAKEYTGFTAQDFSQGTIVGDGSTIVEIRYNRNTYAITWVDGDGNTIKTDDAVKYGDTPNYEGATPTKSNSETQTFVFVGWEVETVTGDATYTAKFNAYDLNLNVTTENHEIVDDVTIISTTVHTDAVLTVDEGKTLTTNTFVIEAISEVTDTDEAFDAAQSGSGEAVGNVVANHVYFDLTLNNPTNRRWNAFTVPFKVDLRKSGNPIQINGETLTLGRGYDIIYYDGSVRAAEGKTANCWKYVEDEDSVLYPGKAYMIASASRAIQIVRFTKASDAPIMYDGKVAVAENNGASDGVNGGWNGIGNPMMYHAVMDAGVLLCQVHDGGPIGSDGYRTYDMEEKKLVVGKAVFVQVGSDDDVTIVRATDQEAIKPPQAPRRTRQQIMEDRYDVQIAANGGVASDRLLILTEEEKDDQYVILKDLSKAGVSPVRAQMWVDRYGEKLCMNTTALINNKADYPLTISAPKAGEYDIFLNNQPKEGTILYLTYDGRAIWNLTYGGYTATLEKGLDTHYGLRVVISKTPTGLEEATIENGDAVRKVIVDDKVFIIRNGEIYSVTGQKAQ